MKKFIEYIIAVLLFILIFDKITLLMVRKGNGYGTDVLNFYKQEKNSINVLVLGSSHAYSSFNPYLIEEQTGLITYDFCTQQQPIWITYYYLKEALKYQTPKYLILEVHMAVANNEDYSEEQVNRDAIDKMKFSLNKINAIRTSVQNINDQISYYFSIIKYHSRYKEINENDKKTAFSGYTINNKGYIGLPKTDYKCDYKNYENEEIEKIHDKSEDYLKRIIKLSKENNIKLILVKTPAVYSENEYKKLNYINKIAVENDIMFLNYIKNIEALYLDFNNDFYDKGHLNKLGSEKFTKKFIEDAKMEDIKDD
ncbi:MAG: hypothetical protein J5507_01045 [Clostridia bacterium]|nr:hypothetical protein [Clostridia bacterium]